MSKPKAGDLFQERYLIVSELGAGGMGMVFRARQIDADREVALKLLRNEQIGDQENVDRFYREFKLLSRLSHPNIMTLYAVALDVDSLPYAICEYLEGTSLRTVLNASGALPWQRAVKIAMQVCKAMQYAHEQGVVHRDLKPDNVMLVDRPEPDFVKLVDFGLSRMIAGTDEVQKLTITGQLVGSANYMSPEIVNSRADERSDIYSLGCVLFEMIAGEYLFDADVPVGIIFRHCNEDPSGRFVAIKSRIPEGLLTILAKMLSKRPENRYASMRVVAEELQSLLDDPGDAINATDSAIIRSDKSKSNHLATGLVSLLVVALLAGAYVWFSKINPSVKKTRTASAKLAPLPAVLPRNGNSMAEMIWREQDRDRSVALAERWLSLHLKQSSCPAHDKIRVLNILCDVLNGRENVQGQTKVYEQVEALLPALGTDRADTELKYSTLKRASVFYFLVGEKDKATQLANEVLNYCASQDDRLVFFTQSQPCMENLILCGKYNDAIRLQGKLEKTYMSEAALAGENLFRRVFYSDCGDALVGAGEFSTALRNYEKSAEISRATIAEFRVGKFKTENNIRFARITGIEATSQARADEWNGECRSLCLLAERVYRLNKSEGKKLFAEGVRSSLTAQQYLAELKDGKNGRPLEGPYNEQVLNSKIAENMGLPEVALFCARAAEECLKGDKSKPEFWRAEIECRGNLALRMMNQARDDEAVSEFKKALSAVQAPEKKAWIKDLVSFFAVDLAWSSAEHGHPELVDSFLKTAEEYKPASVIFVQRVINAKIAGVLEFKGESKKAEKYWQLALNTMPGTAEEDNERRKVDYSNGIFDLEELLGTLIRCRRFKDAENVVQSESHSEVIDCANRTEICFLSVTAAEKIKQGKFSEAVSLLEKAHALSLAAEHGPRYELLLLPKNIELKLLISECKLAEAKAPERI